MTIEQTISQFEDMALTLSRNAVSKKYYNEKASEEDAQAAMEHRQVADWLKELKRFKDLEQKGYKMIKIKSSYDEQTNMIDMLISYEPFVPSPPEVKRGPGRPRKATVESLMKKCEAIKRREVMNEAET